MKDYVVINKFKAEKFGTRYQREIAKKYDVRIRRTKKSFPLWEISSRHSDYHTRVIYHALCTFGCKYMYSVECHKFNAAYKNGWHTQLVEITNLT